MVNLRKQCIKIKDTVVIFDKICQSAGGKFTFKIEGGGGLTSYLK